MSFPDFPDIPEIRWGDDHGWSFLQIVSECNISSGLSCRNSFFSINFSELCHFVTIFIDELFSGNLWR